MSNSLALELDDEDVDSVSDGDDESDFLNSVLDQMSGLIGGGEDPARELLEERHTVLEQDLVRPTDQSVIETAVEVLIRAEQERKYEEWGIEEDDPLEPEDIRDVNFDINKPEDVLVVEFGLVLQSVYDELITRIKERDGDDEVNPIVEQDPETMSQIIGEEYIGRKEDLTIVHGARNILYNICDELGYTDHEREIVQLAHRIAARKNGLHRFVLVNDVLFFDTTLSERVKDVNTDLPVPRFESQS